ncbi:MAG: restriction endonuclease [Chloroflexi bacterium]|nr:Eco57I restriction-modification methylase domain-containing protein [Ardenticatenaceae bacterium]MBL1127409.1 restriction endonuclease [Chloroflexota bacterium]NOG33471.1 restriction endonuclease [Chloroflexota bacterium]GIK55837.1 MAG: type III restriction endonuclease [Chloroflexota bacterium]
MNKQAQFTLHGRNPDVLSCIANLSNDEVFTPPELANRMLDMLAEAWAADHDGANIWADKTVRFLDPCAKSGVFLRQITSRLTAGLADEIPDLAERVNHILTRQVYGIAITHLTSLLARRSVYCSKQANGKHSIARGFASEAGNIWFERLEHTWRNTKCEFCGAPKAILDREEGLETHAYAFIHTDDIKTRLAEMFGGDMQFDVIIGNPPYQMTDAAGGGVDSSIYHLFVDQAKRLDPRYVSMVIPSRWMAGATRGVGDFDGFRERMLTDGHLCKLVDYSNAREAFPGVEIKGGVCYFLWDSAYNGLCEVTTMRDGESITAMRELGQFDVFVRDPRAVVILEKVLSKGEPSVADILTNTEPFKYESNFKGWHKNKQADDIPIYLIANRKRTIGFTPRSQITKNNNLIDSWKVLVVRGYGAGETVPHQILGKPWIAPPPSVCTGSFMFFYVSSEAEAISLQSYFTTRFFRFLVSLRKITQNAFRSTYSWVPVQTWDRQWTDEALYKKYGLTSDEIEYIEAVIRPMDLSGDVEDE